MKRNAVAVFSVLLSCAFLSSRELWANPQGGTVAAGSATINTPAPHTLTIDQFSNRLIINWQDFSIGAGETTRFVQPSSTAEALNRVITGNPSLLYGTLQANGRVFLINQNGIVVGKGGQIDTAGFAASTLDLSDAAFLAGKSLHFSGNSPAAINNFGTIAALGGDVFLIAQTVENSGQLRARAGTVGLAAGSDVILVPRGDERLSVLAGNAKAPSAVGVNNVGRIEAAAAELKAAGGNLYALAINNGGVVRATGVVNENGHIELRANGANIQNSGALVANDANGGGGTVVVDGGHNPTSPSTVINSGDIEARGNATGTKGGEVEILGDHVGLFGNARVDVSGAAGGGTALIGGGLHGQDPSVNNAERTYIDQNAVITADALSHGDGGQVIVWADNATAFYGNISARGGTRGGNAGFAEVSGRNMLIYDGSTDLLAPRGGMGTLLLDPGTITIATGGNDKITAIELFTDKPGSSLTFDPARVVAALKGANLILQANSDININNSVNASGNSGSGTLTLQTGRSIIVAPNVAITLNGAFLARINDNGAQAADRASGAATFSMGAGSSITAPGGILITTGTLATDSAGSPTSVDLNTGDITLTTLSTTPTKVGAKGGNIQVDNNKVAGKDITISGSVTSSGANNSAGAGGNAGTITLLASGNLSVGTVTANGGNGGSGAGGNGGTITLTTSGGTLTVLSVGALVSRGGDGTGGVGGNAGNMTVNAGGALNAGPITSAGGNGTAGTGSNPAAGTGGDAGTIALTATGTLTVDTITSSGGNSDSDVGGNAGSVTINTSEALNLGTITSSGGNSATGAGGNAGTISVVSAPSIAVNNPITARGGTGSSAGTDGSVVLTADNDITFNNNITAGSVISHSGAAGSGDTTFGASVQINADSQSYQAGNGGGTAVVDLLNNTPAFRNTAGTAAPDSFTFQQDAPITDANLPDLAQFAGTAPAAYTIQSDNGAVTLNTGDKVAGSALTLSAAGAVTLNASLTLASLNSHSGGAGSGDTTFGAGVQINADSQSYQAGNGGGTAVVDLLNNTPAFRNTAGTAAPDSFTFRQDAAITDANLPDLAQFGGTAPAAYTIQSDNGALTLDTGANVAGSALTLSAAAAITLNASLTLASINSHSGGAGSGDTTFGAAVQINADSQSYQAGNGGGTAVVDLLNNTPAFRNTAGTAAPDSFTFRQDPAITDANLPDLAQFGGTVPAAYTIQSDNGAVTLNAGAKVLGSALTLSAAGALTINDVLNLASLNASGGSIVLNSGTITTTGAQTYNSAVTLGNDTTLTGSTMTFNSTVDAAQALTISGDAVFGGAVGNGTALSSVHVTGTTALNAPTITTAGSQTYDGAATLGNNGTLTSASGDITFGSTLDGNQQLALSAAGTITFGGTVGGNTALAQINILSAADTALNADVSVSTFSIRSPSTFAGPRVISADSMGISGAMNGTGRLTLQPLTVGLSIDLGSAGASTTLGLTAAELSLITADVLQIGNASAGNITISGAVAPHVPVLSLQNTGSIIESSGGGITVPQLAIRSGGPVLLTSQGRPPAGNHIQSLAVQFSGTRADQRVLLVNNAVAPNLDTSIDGLVGISPSRHVQFVINGFGPDTWAEQLAAVTYPEVSPWVPPTARFSSDPRVDRQIILDLCGSKCIWTPGVAVPWSAEENEDAGLKSRWVDKVEDQSKWVGGEWSIFGTAASPPATQ